MITFDPMEKYYNKEPIKTEIEKAIPLLEEIENLVNIYNYDIDYIDHGKKLILTIFTYGNELKKFVHKWKNYKGFQLINNGNEKPYYKFKFDFIINEV